jgi:hypothetical protein
MPTVRAYVHRNIRKCEASTLDIIAAMPRSTLIPQRGESLAWDECVILDMPITRTNPDALKTLAIIFHGPPKEELTFPRVEIVGEDPKQRQIESSFARLLTALFYAKKPNMFSDLVSHIETIAMKENALAALGLVRALITSSWSTEPVSDNILANDATYNRLGSFPKSGFELILEPSISGLGDAENAAYKVAMAKFDVLKALGQKLEEDGGRQDVLAMVRRRVGEGPWGVQGGVGSRIGTLEL